ncbi:amino acid adenylation domain-containing protein [Corallococcus sp. AB049A]|nr:amino acid adenylation domain-containing protein [Corallococcus sp. AB049A]
MQERVWRLEQHLPGLSAYTIPFVLRLEGPADASVLERAIQEVVQRHESLRTTYDAVDGRPVQRFHPHVRIPLPIVEVEGTPEAREEAALHIAREDAARPFDLARGPVLRTTLVRLRADLHLLVCAIHHIVCDTLSTSLFLQEVGQLYAAFLQGRPSPLAPLPVQYADFGAWQRRSLAEARFPEQEQWWRQRLAGMPRQLGIPTDRPRPPSCPLTSERMVLDFPPELAEALVAFGRSEGFTSYMTVLAAWNALLHRYTGQADLIVGTPIGNRTRPELLPLIGYVAHSAAFRTHVGDDPSFRDLLHRVRREVTDVQSRPDVPFELLVEQLVPGRDIGRERMTDTVFVYHSNLEMGGDALTAVGARGTFIEVPGTPVQWGATLSDLTLILTEEPGRVHGALEYATELFDASTARRMLEHLQVLLGAALARPEERLSRLPLATEAERQSWPVPPPVTQAPVLPARLREHALRQPDAVAVQQAGRTWTWRELASRARRLALRLREQGLRPGEPVALCLRASPEKLAALWGVLEAGGAPVALGPTDLDSLAVYAVEGSVAPWLVTWRGLFTSARLESSRVLHVEEELGDGSPVTETLALPSPESLAWLLPMGAGQPAWALSHTSLTGFFAGLDARLRPAPGTTWLAASEPAPQKPELEALWALSRGLRVLFPSEASTSRREASGEQKTRPLQVSLSYFANDEDSLTGPKYELLMEGAKFADANGFSAIWTPERHFHSFGGIYPQPAVVSAALASVTRNLRLRSGSVVLPLHDPLLVAEQWAVVDNLSQGRVDVSVATGWHVQDFIFAPGNYADRRNILLRHLETLRGLWRGERLRRPGGNGVTVEVGLRPKPVQRELPVWLTATANPETFRLAGELGAGVLTGLFAHSLEELKPKVALYREAWRRNGHPGRGHITCMLHTYLGDDEAEVLRQVRKPLLAYFRSSADITASLLAAQGYQGEIAKVSREDIDALLEHTFEHHAKGTGLIGTVESGIQRLRDVRASDVDEVTCLIDFGLETPVVLEGLRRLARAREAVAADAASHSRRVLGEQETDAGELLSLAKQSGAVLVNTTARLARALTDLTGAREALAPVGAWVLENASEELASALQRTAGGDVLIAGEARDGGLLPRAPEEKLPPGLDVWVLDAAGAPVPAGVVGELALSGAGLPIALWRAKGDAPDRLVPHPLHASASLYRTGRAVRLRADGRVEAVNLPGFKLPSARPALSEANASALTVHAAAGARPAAPGTLAGAGTTTASDATQGTVQLPATGTAVTSASPADPRAASTGSKVVAAGALQAIPRAPRDQPLPLSFAQQRLWYLQELEPESTAYNNAIIFRLTGTLNVSALQTALHSLVERHEVLRTTYALGDTGAVQVIHATGTLPLEFEDVPGATAEAREAAMLRRCQAYTATPFRLDTGPVARALLLRLAPDTHVLHLLLHHVVSDAWCALVLSRELPVLYACASAGVPSVLPPLPVQYADYAVWQRTWLTGPVLDEQGRWWRDQLQGTPPLELPTDRPRPAAQSYAGAAHAFHLPRELSEPLLALGRREGATSFMVLMALFQVLLSRTSGQDDFAVGTPIAGRSRPEVEGLLGCFVNTLAFRAKLGGAPGFRQLVARVKQQALGAYARQDMPFEQLVDVLQVPRDLSRTPVFQVILNVINVPEAQTTGGAGLQIGGVDVPVTTSKFDLTLEVYEQRDGLRCRLEYATALFDAATLERMAEHLTELAKAVVATPDAPVTTLPLLTPAAREQVLRGWNDTRVEYPRGATLHQLFEAQAERTPEAIAVQFEDQRLTYAQLDARANQLAHHLRAHGAGPETLVGVCLERSLEMVVALLGILKSGAAYVPLDPATPAERLAGMLEDTGAPVLLVQERFRALLPAQVISLDTQWETIARESTTRPVPLAGEDSLAYVIFTSGSTGRPKGAMNAHAGIVNRLRWMQGRYVLTPDDTVLQKTPFSFDVSVWEFFWPLMTGARLVLARPGGHQEPDYLMALMAREGVTTAHFVPSMLRAFVEEPGLESLTRLRQVMCSGEALPADLVLRAQSRLPHTTLHNLYGPTEAAVDVTSWECPRDTGLRVVPIGRPVANTAMYVLDRHGQPVPMGIPGELFIGGAQVGRGYWRRPTLTAERFLPDAFSTTPGARMYRTGDIARWRPDGTLEYLGRADFQVKLRGFRIEPGDIEAAVQSWPGVRDSVCVVRQEGTGGPRLVAYVSTEGRMLDVTGLRAFLQARLPEYMVPSAFVRLEALPLTSSGKVDRKALPAPDAPTTAGRTGPIAPRDDTERALAEIFSQVLGITQVGVRDSFFELGGHSLLATQVAARVRARLGQELPLRTLFEAPTVEALARRITPTHTVAPTPAEPTGLTPLTRAVRPAVLPLSFAQQRLWFIHQLGAADTAYNMPFSLLLEGTLDVGALQRSFDRLVRRHEALRTTFREYEGAPEQVIHAPGPLPLRQVDLTGLPDLEQRRAEAGHLAREEARTPFDLEQGPLLRALLLKLSPTEHVLVLNLHHIISDGWSTGVLVREMGALYTALSQNLPAPLPELPVQYADHALWQRGWLQGAVLDSQLGYWRRQLEGAPSHLELPTDHPRPARQTFQGALTPFTLPQASSEALEALAKREGATPYMVLLAAFQVLLGRYAGQDDVLVGSPIAGRRHAESEPLIGYFANTVVLRTRLREDDTFLTLLTRVRDATLGAYEHQDLPFEKLVEDLHPARDASRTPFFQVTFTLQNAPLPPLALPGLTLQPMNADPGAIRFDLELLLHRAPEGFTGGLNFNTALFTPGTVAGMARQLQVLLDAAVASPTTPLTRLPLLTPEERRQVLVTRNGAGTEYPRDASVPALFAEQAARTPDAVAVRMPAGNVARELTYGELDRRSNQLAHHLRRMGVRPGDRVGLCVERSPELITGMLGILKAGAAYVPVEAKAPADRTAWVLQEAGVGVLVTQEALADELPAVAGLLVLLDAEGGLLAKQPDTALDVRVPAEALAYVMFTSGSTGRPKGVSVPHRGIVRLVRGNGFITFGPEQVFLQAAPVAFDASTLELWGALLHGAKLVLAPPRALSLSELGTLLVVEGVTTLWLTAALFEQMVLHEGATLAGVRQVLAGGDVLPVPRVREHLSRMAPDAVLVNGYGPTENTTFSTTHTLRAGDTVERSVPIGRPLANSSAWVLDAHLQPLPPGLPGELYVGGDGLAWGYLQLPDLTAERFIPHPHSATPGARLYRTGDRARWRDDGTLEFLGRTDFQLKLRGFRIEPGEIEAVLRQVPDVREAVVLAREDVPGEKRLVAYVVLEEDSDGTDRVKEHAQRQLPDYMVPAAWVALPSLPLSPNGKVDRKALPAPEAPTSTGSQREAPRNALESQLAAIWAEVLHVEAVGIHDDFFDLGGHSLLATQVVSRIRTVLGVELPLGELFNAPTVAALARHLGAATNHHAHVPPLVSAPRPPLLPLSFAQQRLWFIDQLEPGSALYNMPVALRLLGALDEAALKGSLDALMARHEALRTTFRMEAGQPVQHIHARASVPLEHVDLSTLEDAEARLHEAERLATLESQRPFDLERGPVIRALLLRLAKDEHVLVLHLHHIVSDGWSLGVMVRELTALYAALREDRPPALPELPVQYADYALWQRAWLQGEALEAQLEWWAQQLEGAPRALELPTDKPRPAVSTQRGDTVPVHLPLPLSERVEALAKQEGATPFMVLLAAFQTVLHRYSGQDDVLVGTPIANRRHAETEGLIGFFVNTLVLRGSFSARTTFRELLTRVRATTLGAYEHQDVPFERLVESLQTTRDLGRMPLFQVMFALQNAPVPELSLPGLTVRPAALAERTTSQFDLSLDLNRREDGYRGTLEYATDLFGRPSMARLLTHLSVLLDAVLTHPDAPLSGLSLVSEEERRKLLGDLAGSTSPFDGEGTLHGRFEEQVARTPDADAVVFGDTTLSFRQLNARANQLAWHLRSLGVGPEVTVALCLERSAEAIIALLAVNKAGGAFVPLDPSAPAARRSFVLKDCGATVLVTTRALQEAWRPEVAHLVRLDEKPVRQSDRFEETGSAAGALEPVGHSDRLIEGPPAAPRNREPVGQSDRLSQSPPAAPVNHEPVGHSDRFSEGAPVATGNREPVGQSDRFGEAGSTAGAVEPVGQPDRFVETGAAAPKNREPVRQSDRFSDNLPPAAGSGNLAYVIYTSGSTGTPKGVMVRHRSLLHLRHALLRTAYADQPSGLRVSVNAPLFFDASIEQVLQLLGGHCLCPVPEDLRLEPERMLTWLEEKRVDALDCTPAQLRLLLDAGMLERSRVPSLILVGGEALDEVMWQRLATTRRTRAFNAYGPTECTVDATVWDIPATSHALPVIGRPLDNLRAYVLDERQELVPFGLPGELCFAGEGVARGYLGRPHLTAERFMPDPFSTEPGARLYRTGDKARWREDGTLEFMGRLDFQVKLRGHRIEPGEIETLLRAQPGVRDAVALVREDVPGDARLVAYVTPEVDTAPLHEHLRGHLPDYMVPAAVLALPVLPLTPNGKVDRKALPAPDASRLPARSSEPPATPAEARLASIWEELLRVPRVGRHDNFFELGGHSILATQVVARVRAHFGVELRVRTLFEAPTVAALARRLPDAMPALPPLTRMQGDGLAPLSFAQQRLWFIDQLEPGSPLYNMPFALRLTGALDVPSLQRAFDALAQRHEALRTTFETHDGTPHQRIHPAPTGTLRTEDLESLPAEQRDAEVWRRVDAEALRPFDLGTGPLARFTLLRLDAREHVLVICTHHSVSDGWSFGVLVRELVALYEAFRQGQPSPLPELPVQYADFARWQAAWMEGPVLEGQLGWWKRQLEGAPHALALPTDRPRPARRSAQGALLPVQLTPALSDAVEALAKRENATPFMVLLAAFQWLLSRYAGQDDVLVGSPIANRRHAETEGLIGFFVNTLVLRARFPRDTSFRKLLAQVRATTLGAYEHQDLPFERLVEALQPERDLGRTPLFQALFALHNTPDPDASLPGLTLTAMELTTTTAKFDLDLALTRLPEGFQGALTYSTDLFDAATVQRLMERWSTLLETLLAAPDAPLDPRPLLTEEELRRMHVPEAPAARPSEATEVSPRDGLERELVALWEELLGVRPIGVTRPFFELGGHSLLAVKLMARIRERFHRELPLAALFQAPTVETLAWLLRQAPEVFSPLVPIQREGSRRPFFCVHPVGGNVLAYAALAKQLGPEQPFYGLQSQGLDGGRPPLDSVEAMAALYVAAVRTVQPHGPYRLGGWSMGGVVAFEMARQLQARGETVEFVALIDPSPATDDRVPFDVDDPGRVAALFELDQGQLAEQAAATQEGRTLLRVFTHNLRALKHHRPGTFTGRVLLLQAGDDPARGDDGWSAHVQGELTREVLPGTHYTLLQPPHVQRLAGRLREALMPRSP